MPDYLTVSGQEKSQSWKKKENKGKDSAHTVERCAENIAFMIATYLKRIEGVIWSGRSM